MTFEALAADALTLALEQRDALAAGDIDTFLARADTHTAACRAVADADASTPAGLAIVGRLITANAESQALLDGLMGEVAVRLMALRSARNATGAYLASPAATELQSREA